MTEEDVLQELENFLEEKGSTETSSGRSQHYYYNPNSMYQEGSTRLKSLQYKPGFYAVSNKYF